MNCPAGMLQLKKLCRGVHHELRGAMPSNSCTCGAENFRPSRLRLADAGHLPLLHYPVRCRACHQRGYVSFLKIFAVRRDAKTRGWHAHIRCQRHQKILALVAVALAALALLAFFAFLVFGVSGRDSDNPGHPLTIQKEVIVSPLSPRVPASMREPTAPN